MACIRWEGMLLTMPLLLYSHYKDSVLQDCTAVCPFQVHTCQNHLLQLHQATIPIFFTWLSLWDTWICTSYLFPVCWHQEAVLSVPLSYKKCFQSGHTAIWMQSKICQSKLIQQAYSSYAQRNGTCQRCVSVKLSLPASLTCKMFDMCLCPLFLCVLLCSLCQSRLKDQNRENSSLYSLVVTRITMS